MSAIVSRTDHARSRSRARARAHGTVKLSSVSRSVVLITRYCYVVFRIFVSLIEHDVDIAISRCASLVAELTREREFIRFNRF